MRWSRTEPVPGKCYLWQGQPNFGHHIWETEVARLFHEIALGEGLKFLQVDGARCFSGFSFLYDSVPETVNISPDGFHMFERLLIPCQVVYRDRDRKICISAVALEYFKTSLDFRQPAAMFDNGKIVFISRADALHRILKNEIEVIERLAKFFDVQVIRGRETELFAQVRLMREARSIICPIGAATAITAFCPSATEIIELSPHKSIWGMYNSRLGAAFFGQDYLRINGLISNDRDAILLNKDYSIEPNAVLHALSLNPAASG